MATSAAPKTAKTTGKPAGPTPKLKGPTNRSKRDDVMSYTHLLDSITADTGLRKAQVRKVLEASQRIMAEFLRAKADNRIHYGRFGVIFSKMTTERQVNNPRDPGKTLTSPAHLVVRLQLGSRAQEYMTGKFPEWDSAATPDDESADDSTEVEESSDSDDD